MSYPARLDLQASRWTPFDLTIEIEGGIDLSGAAAQMQVRILPDAGGSPLVNLPLVTTPIAAFLQLTVATLGGEIVSFLHVYIDGPTMAGLPAANELGQPAVLAYDIHITPSGLSEQAWFYGNFIVNPGVTQ